MKVKSVPVLLVVVSAMLLAACGKDNAEPQHSVDYYKQHKDEREAILKKCRADPDLITRNANCRAAGDAVATGGSYEYSTPQAWKP